MMNDALSRPGQGFHIGYQWNGGIRAMSKHHPTQGPYRIRTQCWNQCNKQAPSQPKCLSDIDDDGSRPHPVGGYIMGLGADARAGGK